MILLEPDLYQKRNVIKMEFLVVFGISLILLGIAAFIFGVNIKKLKEMVNIKPLDEIAEKYPNNIEICQDYLKKLGNTNVKVQEDEESEATVYIAVSDKICIGDMKKSYARIQTIAHECLHSIQNRKILLFNFFFSNIYLIYFAVIVILALCGILPNQMMFLVILCMLGLVQFAVRQYLENDAMIKARYLAKEYMEEKGISTKEEIESLVKQFDEINDIGIASVQYKMLAGIMLKIAIFSIISFLR